ncbi:MAG: TRAP transporter large permease subunit, partial [Hyphomicrobiales bacterium]|nr:TRAP transporter large permease subunit [Hyphomicrobiales bacterium]
MTPGVVVLIILALMMGLILLGFHIGVVLGITSALGVYMLLGGWDAALSILSTTAYEAIRADVFAVIPLFVLMGDVVSKCGAARDLYHVCDRVLRRLPGRLAIATVAGNAIFAAVTGVSIAAAASFSRFAYPEMRRLNYSRPYALGVVAGSAVLGMLIPPSILLIVYGYMADVSVAHLFMAGFLPGLLTAVMFSAMIAIRVVLNPKLAPSVTESITRAEKIAAFKEIWPLPVIIFSVLAGIFVGVFSPTEAGAIGAALAIVLALVTRRLSRASLARAILDTLVGTASIFMVVIGTA